MWFFGKCWTNHLNRHLIFQSVDLEEFALEFGILFKVPLVYSIELGVKGESKILQIVDELNFKRGNILVDPFLLPWNLILELPDIPLLILQQLRKTDGEHFHIIQWFLQVLCFYRSSRFILDWMRWSFVCWEMHLRSII